MNVIGVVPIVVLTVILTVAVITDIRLYRIPNWLTFPSMLFGICYHTYTNGFHGFALCMAGLLLGICIFVPGFVH